MTEKLRKSSIHLFPHLLSRSHSQLQQIWNLSTQKSQSSTGRACKLNKERPQPVGSNPGLLAVKPQISNLSKSCFEPHSFHLPHKEATTAALTCTLVEP